MPFRKTGALCYALLVFCCAGNAVAAAWLPGERPQVRFKYIRAVKIEDRIGVRFAAVDLFNDRVRGTIQSGLPAVVAFEVRLQRNGKELARRNLLRSISYNIWSERYFVKFADSVRVFTDFDSMEVHVGRCDELDLAPVRVLDPRRKYTIRLRVAVSPISSFQNRKLSGWLQAHSEEEDLTSEEQKSGFQINLSRLIDFFFGGRREQDWYSPWHTVHFYLTKLP